MIYPHEIHIEPANSFFHPNWIPEENLEKFFNQNTDEFEGSIVYHLWQTTTWKKYLKNLTVEEIKSKDTTFNKLARKFLD